MSKKFLSIILVSVFIISLMLTSCGGSNTGTNDGKNGGQAAATNAPASSSNKQAVIKFYHWTPESGVKPSIDEFNRTHSDIKLEYVKINDEPDMMIKLNSVLASGEQVDICANVTPDDLRLRVQNGMYEPLDDYFKAAGLDYTKTFGQSVYDMEQVGGKIYAVPYALKVLAVYYNKNIFKAEGIPFPTNDWTWQEFRETCKKLAKGEGANKRYGWISNIVSDWKLIALQKLSTNAIYKNENESNYDHPIFLESLKWLYEMQSVDKSIMPYDQFPAKKLDVTMNKVGCFFRQESAMDIGDSYWVWWGSMPDYKHDFNYGVVQLPKADKSSSTTTRLGYSDLSIPKNSKLKKEAFEFVKFVCIDRPDLFAAPKGMLPPVELKDEAAKKNAFKFLFDYPTVDTPQAFWDLFYDKNTKYYSEYTTISAAKQEINAAEKEEITRVFYNEKKPEQALADLKKRADDLIKKAKAGK